MSTARATFLHAVDLVRVDKHAAEFRSMADAAGDLPLSGDDLRVGAYLLGNNHQEADDPATKMRRGLYRFLDTLRPVAFEYDATSGELRLAGDPAARQAGLRRLAAAYRACVSAFKGTEQKDLAAHLAREADELDRLASEPA